MVGGGVEAPPEPSGTEPVDRLMHGLGHRFSDRTLLLSALTHRSYTNENQDPTLADNERLEFLGDAVIDLVVSSMLMERHPEACEGVLSKMRAAVVSEAALAKAARKLGVGEALRLGRGESLSGGRDKPSLLADAYEALMAALYLEHGLDAVRTVLEDNLEFPEPGEPEARDAKSRLQQRVQALWRVTPSYRLRKAMGPDHDKTFVVELTVREKVLAEGRGRTKKDAEQEAARSALERFDQGLMPEGTS